MFLFFLIFFTVFSAVNYYIFIRGWQALQGVPVLRTVYFILFLIVSLSYLAAKFFERFLPIPVYEVLTWIGSFWFAYILYFFLFIILFDIIRLGNHLFNFYPDYVKNNYLVTKQIVFSGVVFASTIIIIAGYINTRNIQVKTVNLTIPAKSSKLENLKIVMASDIHLSPVNHKAFLENIINKINELNPDLVLIAGDMVDEKPYYLQSRGNGIAFKNIKARYGVYSSMGNHEFINGGSQTENFMNSIGMKVLRDTAELIDNSFYIVGRDDSSKINFTGKARKTLKEITMPINSDYPVILLDHTPFRLEEAAFQNIDLQLSGHTHHGQLFPLNFITSKIYEVSWGYKKKNNTHYYVSSGAGTWGPPVRTGSSSEIVLVNIKFEAESKVE
jgi:uncharacterized protein